VFINRKYFGGFMKKISVFGIALVVFSFVLAGCTQSSPTSNLNPTTNPDTSSNAAGTMPEGSTMDNDMVGGDAVTPASNGSTSESYGGSNVAAVKEIAVDSFSYGFTPGTIRVKAGEPVRLNVTNKGGFHDIQIPEFNVKVSTPDGKTTPVEFTPTKAGTYEFFCGVGNHKGQGQKGTLIVE